MSPDIKSFTGNGIKIKRLLHNHRIAIAVIIFVIVLPSIDYFSSKIYLGHLLSKHSYESRNMQYEGILWDGLIPLHVFAFELTNNPMNTNGTFRVRIRFLPPIVDSLLLEGYYEKTQI